ncbi:hypothetical protein ACFQ2B_07115 [Streptomyces stramineus]|uniref:Uncharacterized protein n=1 Tax=Streptomyces stramineus TaxID=173861 RepID=A0ABN0ZI10_9ACTN
MYVPVPRQFVAEVQAYVVQLSGHTTVEGDASGEKPAGETLSEQWTVEVLQRLAATQLPSTQSVSRLLDVLARHAGDYVSTTRLVELLDIDRTHLRGALSAFSRHLKKHFHGRDWPMTWIEQLSPSPDFKTEFFYTVDGTIAQRWQQIRAEA